MHLGMEPASIPGIRRTVLCSPGTERTPTTSSPWLFFRIQRPAGSQRPFHFTFGVFPNPFSVWDLQLVYGLACAQALPIHMCDWPVQPDRNKVTLVLWFIGSGQQLISSS